ncbi:MAG: monovalent cation/H(+) antiporter subunit G [Oscillospiraceae bacterium]|nr:monovalent cation/H(+) antiporter subunit G [Oscillospiraceae bacterium]
MSVLTIFSYIFIIAGLVFMLFGIVGIFTNRDFYTRLLVSSKIDIVGSLTLILGLALRHGFSFFTGKLALLFIIILILAPLNAHVLGRCAFFSQGAPQKTSDSPSKASPFSQEMSPSTQKNSDEKDTA